MDLEETIYIICESNADFSECQEMYTIIINIIFKQWRLMVSGTGSREPPKKIKNDLIPMVTYYNWLLYTFSKIKKFLQSFSLRSVSVND
jgi:hypothetical protein